MSSSDVKTAMMKTTIAICLFALASAAHAQQPPLLPQPTQNCSQAPPLSAGGCISANANIVYAYSGDARRIGWIPASVDIPRRSTIRYNVEAYTWPGMVRVFAAPTAAGVETILWPPPRAGLYYVRVQACISDCSGWTDSRSTVGTLAGAFLFVIEIKPPTGGGIE